VLPFSPVSSLFQKMKRTEMFVCTEANTRAPSSTSEQPDASSLAAPPLPMPSMCADTMYI
jgi:hypothetical protein